MFATFEVFHDNSLTTIGLHRVVQAKAAPDGKGTLIFIDSGNENEMIHVTAAYQDVKKKLEDFNVPIGR